MSDPGRIPFLRAVKHGAFAKTAILPGEDRREFEELHSALIEEWAPVGPTEEDAVLSIAKGAWRKRRLQKFLHAEMEMGRSDREHPLYDEAQAVRTLLNTLETGPFLKLMEPVPDHFEPFAPEHIETAIRLDIESAPSYIALVSERMCPREQFKSASEWLAKLRQVTSAILWVLEDRGEEPNVLLDRSAKVHTPDVVSHELAVDERIDAMIDRAIKRLVQTKAMKQMLVSASPRGGDDQPPKKNPNGMPRGSGRALNHQDRQGG
jgi:hypothetical protein